VRPRPGAPPICTPVAWLHTTNVRSHLSSPPSTLRYFTRSDQRRYLRCRSPSSWSQLGPSLCLRPGPQQLPQALLQAVYFGVEQQSSCWTARSRRARFVLRRLRRPVELRPLLPRSVLLRRHQVRRQLVGDGHLQVLSHPRLVHLCSLSASHPEPLCSLSASHPEPLCSYSLVSVSLRTRPRRRRSMAARANATPTLTYRSESWIIVVARNRLITS